MEGQSLSDNQPFACPNRPLRNGIMPLSTSHASFSLPLQSNWLLIADNELVQDLRKQDPSSVCEAGDVASCQVKQLSAKPVKKREGRQV